MIRALLVDDEEHALNILRILLERTGDVEIVGEATNGFDALEKLKRLRPDVVFSDIEMPGMNGVELAERIGAGNLDVQVVFVTAYDRYAISAFEKDAVDYLLKPLEMDRLVKTVQRVKKEVQKSAGRDEIAASAEELEVRSSAERPPQLNVCFLGGVSVHNSRKMRMKWRTGKERELFSFLAFRKGERVHRDVIVEALWPEEHYQKSKVYLHTCVSFLRKDLRQLGFDGALLYESEKYHLKDDLFETDYEVFKRRAQKLKAISFGRSVEALESALDLYQGTLFKDEDYSWAEEDALKLEQVAGELRMELAAQYEERRDYLKMTDVIFKHLAVSPYDEEAYRLLMRAQFASGRHEEVFRIYHVLLERFGELGIEPSEMTVELYNEIRRKERP